MASEIIDQINSTIIEAVNEGVKNETTKLKSTPEGMFVAYTSLIIMAVLPIFFGSFRSIQTQKEKSVRMILLWKFLYIINKKHVFFRMRVNVWSQCLVKRLLFSLSMQAAHFLFFTLSSR